MKIQKLAFFMFLSTISFMGFSQINVGTNFNIVGSVPIDARVIVASIVVRDAIVWRYEGMQVFVISDQTNYQLRGGTANSNWVSISTSAYTAGTGLTLTGTVFSHTAHTGDATGITSLTVVAIQGRSIASVAPIYGEVMGWNGSAWAPAAALSNYVSGTGILLSGNTISALNSSAIWNANQLNGSSISAAAPSNNDILKWNGTSWTPGAAYDVGLGISLTGTTFSHTAHTGDATGITSLTVVAIQGRTLSSLAPSNSEVLKWNGTEWAPSAALSNYVGGSGIILSGNTISAQSTTAMWNANLLNGTTVSSTAPASTQVLRYNGSTWIPSDETAYTAGTGLTLTGTAFSITSPIAVNLGGTGQTSYTDGQILIGNSSGSLTKTTLTAGSDISITNGSGSITIANTNPNQTHTGDAIGAGALTVVSIQGKSISSIAPSTNDILKWDGTSWTPGAAYAVGLGITLSGTTFSHTAHTGDATGITSLTVVAIQGKTISSATPSNSEVLKWNGSEWAPAEALSNYVGGSGIVLSGNSITHLAHTGDATGATAITVVGLQGRTIQSTTPSNGDVLTWDNALSTWKPAQTTNSGLYNGNRIIKRPNWSGVTSTNVGTTTDVAAFLNAVFFPFISSTISINGNLLYEIGTTNSVGISGATTANDETSFSAGRVDQIYPSVSTIYSFGSSMSYSTSATFTPIQGTASSLELRYVAYQGVGNNGSPSTINSGTKLVQSCYPYLYGVSSANLTVGGTTTYTTLSSGKLIQTKANKTVSLSGTNGYIYFCFPASYGVLTSILDHNGFEQMSAFNRTTVNVNSSGLVNNWSESYYIYQSNIVTSPVGWNYVFKY